MNDLDSIFTRYGTTFRTDSEIKLPLNNHPQLALIVDILSRRESHHILISSCHSEKINSCLAESIALHIKTGHVAKSIQDAIIIYFNNPLLLLNEETRETIQHDFELLSQRNKTVILIVNQVDQEFLSETPHILRPFEACLRSYLTNIQWRFILLQRKQTTLPYWLESYFTTLTLQAPDDAELLGILRSHRETLENFHNVIIPDDMFAYAFFLAGHYLETYDRVARSLELLDSAAARASMLERHDASGHNPVLTSAILAHVVSAWTHIPLSHLHHNKFKASQFLESMQQHIFGQESALRAIGMQLQQSCIKLQDKNGPLCHFLWVGARGVGKKKTALVMAEHLFGSTHAIYRVEFDKNEGLNTLSDMKVTTIGNEVRTLTLFDAIKKTPYAIILLDNITEATLPILALLKPILMQGVAFDDAGNRYDFQNNIFVTTTSLTAEKLTALVPAKPVETNPTGDLMKLVLNEHFEEENPSSLDGLTLEEQKRELAELLKTYLSPEIMQHMTIIPFNPLEAQALEKIIRVKLNALVKRIETHFGLELHYASEIIKFLANEVIAQKNNAKVINSLFEQHIFTPIAHRMLGQVDDKNRSKRLMLHLNDTGLLICCEPMPQQEVIY